MLVAFAKTVGRKAAPVSRAQIKKRGYATVLRGLNEEVAVLDTTVLEQVLANKEGLKSLEQAYKDALVSQGVARNEIISSIQKEFGNSPYAAVRRASDGFVSALNRVNSSTDVEAAKFSLPLANIDEVLEVHEIAQLTNAYAQAFSQLPYVPTQTAIPIDEITSAFAPAVRFFFAPPLFFYAPPAPHFPY